MPFDRDFTNSERELLLELIHESLRAKSHFELFIWLQGRLQIFMPHEILIAAWGDFSLGLVYFDILSSSPGLRTSDFTQTDLSPLLKQLFACWSQSQSPLILSSMDGCFNALDLSNVNICNPIYKMSSAVVHGLKDLRGHNDYLYVLMNSNSITAPSGKILEALLPYIDGALRRVKHLPGQLPQTPQVDEKYTEAEINFALTERESEIMHWVKEGKTNVEIGMILDISIYTVKNHLQRIYKKLDVLNRAQAAYLYKIKTQEQ
jgi:transcriptional regulator EpsA